MTNNQPKIGNHIQRISNGYLGTVIEVDEVNRRARILWDYKGMPRTKISFKDLLVVKSMDSVFGDSTPTPSIFGEWIATPNSKQHSAFRICKNEARGEEWNEYQKR